MEGSAFNLFRLAGELPPRVQRLPFNPIVLTRLTPLHSTRQIVCLIDVRLLTADREE